MKRMTILLCLFCLPGIAHAGNYTGEWKGSWTYEIDYWSAFGEITSSQFSSGRGVLDVTLMPGPFGGEANISWPEMIQSPWVLYSFTSTSASLSDSAGGYGGFSGDCELTYRDLRSDGTIDVIGGTANAYFWGHLQFPGSDGYSSTTTFTAAPQVLPEPASLVGFACGLIALLVSIKLRSR
jgi:hypothetical protein